MTSLSMAMARARWGKTSPADEGKDIRIRKLEDEKGALQRENDALRTELRRAKENLIAARIEIAQAPPPEAPVEPVRRRPRIADIKRIVCAAYSIDMVDLDSARRSKALAEARQIVMYLSKATLHSLGSIGYHLGGRDHSTVLHGQRTIAQKRTTDVRIDQMLTILEEEIRRGTGYEKPVAVPDETPPIS